MLKTCPDLIRSDTPEGNATMAFLRAAQLLTLPLARICRHLTTGLLILFSLRLMPAAVVLLVLIAISAPVVCRGEHAESTGTHEREVKGNT